MTGIICAMLFLLSWNGAALRDDSQTTARLRAVVMVALTAAIVALSIHGGA